MGFFPLWKARRVAQAKTDKFERVVENCRRKMKGKKPILSCGEKTRRAFSCLCPTLDPDLGPSTWYRRLFIKGTTENTMFRLMRNIIFLELFGLLMYFVMAFKYVNDPARGGILVSLPIHLLLVLMIIFPKVMHYLMLSTYRMMSSKIKTLLVIVIISIAIEVSALNALTNLHRVAQGVACIQTDISESAGAVDENIAKHGELGLKLMQTLVKKLAKPVNFFKATLRKLDSKVTRVVEMVRGQWSQLATMTNRCKTVMRGPYLVCLNKFHEAYIFCMQHERNLGLDLCGAVQRANKICEMGKNVADSVCLFPNTVKNGISDAAVPFFKKTWKTIKEKFKIAHYFKIDAVRKYIKKGKKIKEEIKNLATLNLRVTANHSKNEGNIAALRENIKKTLADMIDTYRQIINFIRKSIQWLLIPVTLLYPFLTTAFFVYKYNYRNDYRNSFMTSEFELIDKQCALNGHGQVMPLNHDEKLLYVPRMRWKMTASEKRKYYFAVGFSLVALFWPATLVLLDILTYMIISGVNEVFKRTIIDFPAHYELKVAGNSTGGELLNSLLETFSPITTGLQEREQRWRTCFQEPNPPNYGAISGMIVLVFVVFILCRLGVWLGRQSLVLADYFYPDRVRPRALHLYNTILQNRRHLMTFMYSKQRAILADDQMAGREQLVRRGLQCRGFVRVNCIRCKKTQMRLSDEDNVRLCVNCGTFYCIACFCFTRWCLYCEENMQIIDKMQLYYQTLTEDELTDEEEGEEEEITAKSGDFQ